MNDRVAVNQAPLVARALQPMSRVLYGGMLAALAYVFLVDGYVRLSTGNSSATALRDVIPLALVMLGLAVIATRVHRIPRIPMAGYVFLFVGVVLAQIASPYAVSAGLASVASRQHLEFVPLFFLGFALINSGARLRSLALVIVIAGALNGVVGLAQVNLTMEQLASWGPGYERLVTPTAQKDTGGSGRTFSTASGEARVRPPALGGDAGFGGVLGALALPLALALALGAGRGREQTLGLVSLPMALVAILTSQTRSAVLAAVFGVGVFLVLGAVGRRGGRIVARSLIASVFAVLAFNLVFSGSIDLSRFDSITPSKLLDTFTGERGGSFTVLPDYVSRYPFGAGLGTSGPVAATRQASTNTGELSGENLFVFLLIELGVPGLLLMLALFVSAIRRGVAAVRSIGDPSAQLLLAALTASLGSCALLTLAGAITAAPPAAPFIWVSIGTVAGWSYAQRRTDAVPSARRTYTLSRRMPSIW